MRVRLTYLAVRLGRGLGRRRRESREADCLDDVGEQPRLGCCRMGKLFSLFPLDFLRTLQKEYAQGPMVVLGRGAASNERGTLVLHLVHSHSAVDRGGNNLYGCEYVRTENGSSRGQDLALTCFLVPSSLDSGHPANYEGLISQGISFKITYFGLFVCRLSGVT